VTRKYQASRSRHAVIACTLAAGWFAAPPALAGGVMLYEIGTEDLGLASAGYTARAQDASTVFTNPAGMTRLDGTQVTASLQALYGDLGFSIGQSTSAALGSGNGGNPIGWFPGGGAFVSYSVSPDLKLGFAATGGPKAASLSVNATNQALWRLVDLLRCPIEIRDEAQRPVWWGYVSEVRVRYGQVEVGVTLEDMANKWLSDNKKKSARREAIAAALKGRRFNELAMHLGVRPSTSPSATPRSATCPSGSMSSSTPGPSRASTRRAPPRPRWVGARTRSACRPRLTHT
jgi:hypothetical protein